ncbi:battenin-like [Rhodnius prolixus]|uniref:battenin-like n=1 Tax=Rhodnius prolixus TaxID=13249 RepID=UPI003D18B744
MSSRRPSNESKSKVNVSTADSQKGTSHSEPTGDNKVKSIRERIFGNSSIKKESSTSNDGRQNGEESKSRAVSEIEKRSNIRKSDKKAMKTADSEMETRSSELKGDKKAKSVAEHQRISETESEKRSTIEFTYSSLQYKIHSVYAPQTDYGLKKREQVPKLEAFKLLVAFWIFGFCNHVGNIVMMTAAEDMLSEITGRNLSRECSREDLSNETYYNRVCNEIGTGAIVVANIAPSIIVKIIAPFLPFMVHVRLIIAEIMTTLGFLTAALGYGSTQGHWMAIFGVIIISFARGLGESTLLAYSVFFSSKNVLSTWSSGTGAAGIVGAFLYSLLRKVNVGVKDTLLIMTIWPMVMATTFWVLVKHPYIKKSNIRFSTLEEATREQIEEEIPTVEDVHTTIGKLKILKRIFLEYMTPYSLAFFFEYLICPTFYEMLYYPDNAYVSCKTDFSWFMSIFLLGVFIARSSVNCIVVNNLWLLALLQIINALVIFFEILYGYLYYILVCAACIFWVGLVAGASYVNTYRRISRELPPLQREFSMSMTTVSDAIMTTLAGLVAIPLHFYLCGTHNPYVERKRLRKLRLS